MRKAPPLANSVWTIQKLLDWAIPYFEEKGIDSPRTTAEMLLAHTLNIKRIDLYLQFDKPLSEEELAQFKSFIVRRVNYEPVAYIIGERGFWSLNLKVKNTVLIPRQDTECLVETVLDKIGQQESADKLSVLELGVGSGAIILSLAKEHPDFFYFATDISIDALAQAKQNFVENTVDASLSFLNSDWFDALNNKTATFDYILSNPPYIPTSEIPKLQKEVSCYEPALALDGGADGLDAIRHIIAHAPSFLKKRGHLIMEIGFDQKESVKQIAEESKQYDNILFEKDLAGHYRVVSMMKI